MADTFRDIAPRLSANDGKKQFARLGSANVEPLLSASGKAALLPRPRHLGDFWSPISILRWEPCIDASFGDELLIPIWFLHKNNIAY